MSGDRHVLYLGPDPGEVASYLPAVEDADVLGTVTTSPTAALSSLRSGGIDCLVVDTGVEELDPTSFFEAVDSLAVEVPVVVAGTDPSVDDRWVVLDADADAAARQQAVRAAVSGSNRGTLASRAGAVLDACPAGLALVVDGRVADLNDRGASLLGVARPVGSGDVDARLEGSLYDRSGEPLGVAASPFGGADASDGTLLGYADAQSPAGPDRWLLASSATLSGDCGSVVVFEDVTALRERQRDLEQRRAELDTAVAELERSNAELEQFAYVASHDLREPLRTVSNYLGLLERRYGDELDEDAQDFVAYAVEGAQRMRRFINDLLEYSRVGREDGETEPVDLQAVVESVRRTLEVRLAETDATLTVGQLPTVQGHEHRLEQLFQNLLSNALKYAGDEPPVVEVTATDDGDWCVVTVADEGVGIDRDRQQQAFDLFYTTGNDESTGIGLALCRKIVRSHGGDITLDSTAGEGTTVEFTLPLDGEGEAPADPDSVVSPRPRSYATDNNDL